MSMFPAYVDQESRAEPMVWDIPTRSNIDNQLATTYDDGDIILSEKEESQLLTSDSEEETTSASAVTTVSPSIPVDYYVDTKADRANLRVSTLYYPGRPDYKPKKPVVGLTKRDTTVGLSKRYWEKGALPTEVAVDNTSETEIASRCEQYRKMLRENPLDLVLWMDYIDYQSRMVGEVGQAAACREAQGRLPRWRWARELRWREATVDTLREELQKESDKQIRSELLTWLVFAGARSTKLGASEIEELAVAAVEHCTTEHYPAVILQYGYYLSSAGQWERLVLLIELLLQLNAGEAPLRPQVASGVGISGGVSGVTAGARWAGEETKRAGQCWLPAGPDEVVADSERQPSPSSVTSLLQPVCGDTLFELAVNILRILDVPLISAGTDLLRTSPPELPRASDLLRHLPHLPQNLHHLNTNLPSNIPENLTLQRRAAAMLALTATTPNYYTDDCGYLTWVESVWDILIGAVSGSARDALLGWRARWLDSLAALGDSRGGLAGRYNALLKKRGGGGGALPLAEKVALQRNGTQAAIAAVSLLLRDPLAPHHHALYAARICAVAFSPKSARRLLIAAILRRHDILRGGEHSWGQLDLMEPLAISTCDEHIASIEQRLSQQVEEAIGCGGRAEGVANIVDLFLPGEAEWAASRLALAGGRGEVDWLEEHRVWAVSGVSAASRYHAEVSCHAATHSARGQRVAATFVHLHPFYAELAMGSIPPRPQSVPRGIPPLPAAVPDMMAAVGGGVEDANRLHRVLSRLLRQNCGGVLWRWRVEAAGRFGMKVDKDLALALDEQPHDKWLYVCGARWGADPREIEELMLERGVRLHVLVDEM